MINVLKKVTAIKVVFEKYENLFYKNRWQIYAQVLLFRHRVAKMRKVLQNGMSFANERASPAVSLRVRYYLERKLFFAHKFYRSL